MQTNSYLVLNNALNQKSPSGDLGAGGLDCFVVPPHKDAVNERITVLCERSEAIQENYFPKRSIIEILWS